MEKLIKKIEPLSAILLFLGLGWVFHRLIILDPVLDRDDRHILATLHTLSSFHTLLKKGHIAELFAFQPVRDLSYFFDLGIHRYSGLSTFHLTNFLLWIAIVSVVYSLLRLLYENRSLALTFSALFALHPLFVGSIGWIAARKHLLSCLFILVATYILIRFQRKGGRLIFAAVGVFLFYALSVLSHPINILWPIWGLIFLLCIPKKDRRPGLLGLSLVCLPVLAIGIAYNLYYYSKIYPKHTSTLKWVTFKADEIGVPALALGRYIFNLVNPTHLAITYYPGSVYNLIGLAIGFVLFVFLVAKNSPRTWLPWFALFILPLILTLARPTNIFVSDTYILFSAFGFLILLISVVNPFWKKIRPALVLMMLGFLYLSSQQARHWESDRSLWTSSYASEPTPRSLVFNAKYLLEDGNYDEVLKEALILESWEPSNEDFPFLFAKSIYLNPAIQDQKKISLLEEKKSAGPWVQYYLASIYAKQGHFATAFDLSSAALSSGNSFGADLPIIAAETQYFCLRGSSRSPKMACKSFVGNLRRKKVWNDAEYTRRLNDLLAISNPQSSNEP